MVFDYVPYLQGRYLTYEEYFALYLFAYTSGLSLLLFAAGVLATFCRRREKPLGMYIDMNRTDISVAGTLFWLGTFALATAVSVLSMFDWVSVWVTILACGAILLARFYCWCAACCAEDSEIPAGEGVLTRTAATHKLAFYALLAVIAGFSVTVPVATAGVCICIYSPELGPNITEEANINTRLSRMLTYSAPCADGKVCFLYLTVPEDPAHFVFINVQTGKGVEGLTVRYGLSREDLREETNMKKFELEGLEKLGQRDVHSALLSFLASDCRYFFQIYSGTEPVSLLHSFRTCPGPTDSSELRLVIGGDAGTNAVSYSTAATVGLLSPHLVAIGGDIAYDNAMATCYQSWDRFLYMVQTRLVTPEQDLIPVVLGLGNHDVGLNAYSERKIEVTNKGPMALAMFPQHFARDSSGNTVYEVPEIESRRSFTSYSLGNALVLVLDSGNLVSYGDAQRNWLESELQNTQSRYRFAVYHQPIYGSALRPDYDVLPVAQGLQYWVPLFDAYNLTVAFENHVHSFKRTIPLRNSLYHPAGTVYVGDGQWGTPGITSELDGDPLLFIKKSTRNHIWLVRLARDYSGVSAIDSDGKEIDSFELA